MPYNQAIEARIKKIVSRWKKMQAKKMFGGVCHLLNGNMLCGVHKDHRILRMGEQQSAEALQSSFARPFDITGKSHERLGDDGRKRIQNRRTAKGLAASDKNICETAAAEIDP